MANLDNRVLIDSYKIPLVFMVLHAFLAAMWNAAGVWLISQGQSPLGPTASLTGVAVLAVFIVIYIFTLKKGYEKSFLLMAFIGALVGLMTIYGALTKDHSFWPSEFWRIAGIAINSLAVIGFVLTLKVFFQRKNH